MLAPLYSASLPIWSGSWLKRQEFQSRLHPMPKVSGQTPSHAKGPEWLAIDSGADYCGARIYDEPNKAGQALRVKHNTITQHNIIYSVVVYTMQWCSGNRGSRAFLSSYHLHVQKDCMTTCFSQLPSFTYIPSATLNTSLRWMKSNVTAPLQSNHKLLAIHSFSRLHHATVSHPCHMTRSLSEINWNTTRNLVILMILDTSFSLPVRVKVGPPRGLRR
jgi:hypothetical protein